MSRADTALAVILAALLAILCSLSFDDPAPCPAGEVTCFEVQP